MLYRALEFWRANFLKVEAASGLLAVALFTCLWLPSADRIWFTASVFPRVISLADGIAGVSASLMGFTVAALSVILVCPENDQVRHVRKAGHYRRLIAVFTSAILWSGFLVLAAFASILAPSAGPYPILASAGLLLGVTLVILRLLRLVWVLEQIVQ